MCPLSTGGRTRRVQLVQGGDWTRLCLVTVVDQRTFSLSQVTQKINALWEQAQAPTHKPAYRSPFPLARLSPGPKLFSCRITPKLS